MYLCSGTVYRVKEKMINSNGEGQEKFGGFNNEDVHRRGGKMKAGRRLDRESKNAEERNTSLGCVSLKQKFRTTLCSPLPTSLSRKRCY